MIVLENVMHSLFIVWFYFFKLIIWWTPVFYCSSILQIQFSIFFFSYLTIKIMWIFEACSILLTDT